MVESENVAGGALNDLLLDDHFQDEIHALLWIDPSGKTGRWDDGWSCRDHVVVLGTLLSERGIPCSVQHGRAAFVQGMTPSGDPPVAVAQEPEGPPKTHSWLSVTDVGVVDLSPRLNTRSFNGVGWRPLSSRGVIGDQWMTEPPTVAPVCRRLDEYANAFAAASHLVDERIAIYLVEEEEDFTPEITARGLEWANSPLSRKLRGKGISSDAYGRASRHLAKLSERRSLASVSQMKAWSILEQDDQLSESTNATP